MVEINEALTRKVAHLARLELSDKEVTLFTSQLGEIIKYVDQLASVDVSGVEPLTHLETECLHTMREDRVEEFPRSPDGTPRVLSTAPEALDGGFKVPPIL